MNRHHSPIQQILKKLEVTFLSLSLLLPATPVYAENEITLSDISFCETADLTVSTAFSENTQISGLSEKPADDLIQLELNDTEDSDCDIPVTIEVNDTDKFIQYTFASPLTELAPYDVNVGSNTSFRYGYTQMNDKQKTLYDRCLTELKAFVHGDFRTKDYSEMTSDPQYCILSASCGDLGLTGSEVNAVFWAIRDDYPEYFWLYYGCSSSTNILKFYIGKEYYSPSVRISTQNAIEDGLAEYQALISGGESDYKIVETIYAHLIDSVEYSYNSSGNPSSELWAHSLGGVFDNHRTVVCEGYSKALQYVLNSLGIETIYITGDAGGGHAWNLIKIDGTYYYADATWDDLGSGNYDGILYGYFLIPASIFERDHKADKPNSDRWLYSLPQASNSSEMTYFSHYGTNLTQYTTGDEMVTAISAAGALVPGNYVHTLGDRSTYSTLASAMQTTIASVSSGIGSIAFINALPYKVKNPASSIALDIATLTLDRDLEERATITATLSSGSGTTDDKVVWSTNNNSVKLIQNGNTATIIASRVGTAIVTATAAAGNVKASCTVTVNGSAYCERMYTDSTFRSVPELESLVAWVNGANYGPTKECKHNFKTSILYTNIKASNIVTTKNGKQTTKKGKLVVGVTMSSEKPTLVKGKIVDSEAASIAKASIKEKTGTVTVTAGKKSGTVYVWVIDTGDAGASAYAQITILAAPSKLVLNSAAYDTSGRAVVKKETLAIGESINVYLEPLFSTKGTDLALDSSYDVIYSKNGENYVQVQCINPEKYQYRITATGLDPAKEGKSVKVTVSFVCIQNGKKTSLSLTIHNPVRSIDYNIVDVMSISKITATDGVSSAFAMSSDTKLKTVSTITPITTLAGNSFKTTDKLKIVKISTPTGFSIDKVKNKITASKPSGDASKIAVKLNKHGEIEFSVPKGLKDGVTAYFLLYYSVDCVDVISVTIDNDAAES